MARLAGSLAALFVVCRAETNKEEPRAGLANNNGINIYDAMDPKSVPSTDKCGVNCYKICGGLGRNGMGCKQTCYSHSIETTRAASAWQAEKPQGKYMQKVRRLLGSSFRQVGFGTRPMYAPRAHCFEKSTPRVPIPKPTSISSNATRKVCEDLEVRGFGHRYPGRTFRAKISHRGVPRPRAQTYLPSTVAA
jgi:hypothetical protein